MLKFDWTCENLDDLEARGKKAGAWIKGGLSNTRTLELMDTGTFYDFYKQIASKGMILLAIASFSKKDGLQIKSNSPLFPESSQAFKRYAEAVAAGYAAGERNPAAE